MMEFIIKMRANVISKNYRMYRFSQVINRIGILISLNVQERTNVTNTLSIQFKHEGAAT